MATSNDGYPDVPGTLAHTIPLFNQMKILTIFDIYRLQLGKLVFEMINKIGPSVIKFTLASHIHHHDAKFARKGKFYNKSVRTTQYGLKGLQVEGTNLWSTILIKSNVAKIKNLSMCILKIT